MKIQTPYDRIHSEPEVNSGEVLVETAGYIDKKTRIENLIEAGERLEASRRGYDAENDEEDIPIDITRRGDFDLVDAQAAIIKAGEASKRIADKKNNATASNDNIAKEKEVMKDDKKELPKDDKV